MSSRIILVTGANKGIGYEAVKYLSQQLPNATILLASRSVENGNAAIKEMQESLPSHPFSNIQVIQLDIVDKSSLDAAVEHVRSKFGKLDDLLHNSGISNVDGDDMSPGVLEVNVRGAKDTIEAFLPLIPADTGRISLVSSEVGAWYLDGMKESSRAKLLDSDKVDWAKTEGWMKDWVSFSKGEKHDIEWNATTNLMDRVYCTSKAILTSWALGWQQRHPEYKLAITTPGYCATELNGFSGPRHQSVGGESVAWPHVNDYKPGHFYYDGEDQPIVFPMSDEIKKLLASH